MKLVQEGQLQQVMVQLQVQAQVHIEQHAGVLSMAEAGAGEHGIIRGLADAELCQAWHPSVVRDCGQLSAVNGGDITL